MPLVLSMSLPMVISMAVNSLYNIVDSIFVAKYSQDALAAVSLVYPLQMLVVAIGVGTGVGVPIDRLVGVRHHEVRVDRYIGGALDGLKDVNAKGQVAGKVAVHNVKVNVVGAGDLVELALEVGHVGRKDGRSDFNGAHGRSLSALVGESVELLRRDAIGKNLECPIQSNTVVERLLHGKGERNVYAQ